MATELAPVVKAGSEGRERTTGSRPAGQRRGVRIPRSVHLFAVPALLLYGTFVIYPIGVTLVNGFYSFTGSTREEWIGLENFRRLFTEKPLSERVFNALGNNLVLFGVGLLSLALAFLVAAVLHQLLRGREFFKAAYFMPKLLSLVVVGFLWQLILSANSGALNNFLEGIGLGFLAQPWLATPTSALLSVGSVNVWHSIGFAILVFLAAIQSIPRNLYEAARLDGASPWRILVSITLPLTKTAWMIMVVLTFVGAFEMFDLVYAMQGVTGSPYYGTDTLGLLFYRLAFGGQGGTAAVGLGSALALVMLVMMTGVSLLILRGFRGGEKS